MQSDKAPDKAPLAPPPDVWCWRRVNVVGTSGSGKSAFSWRLATALQVDYIEMDALNWLPGWQEASQADFDHKLAAAIAADAWVLDGVRLGGRGQRRQDARVVDARLQLPVPEAVGAGSGRCHVGGHLLGYAGQLHSDGVHVRVGGRRVWAQITGFGGHFRLLCDGFGHNHTALAFCARCSSKQCGTTWLLGA